MDLTSSGSRQVNEKQLLRFNYGDETIAFELIPSYTPDNRVRIKVYPDCTVQVSAPDDSCNDDVLAAVKKRSRWIWRQLQAFRTHSQSALPLQYIDGETHCYLGKRYSLQVSEAPKTFQYVKLRRGNLEVSVRQKNSQRVQSLLNHWYKSHAQDLFSKRLKAMLQKAFWIEESPPLRILSMRTQWGNCSSTGQLTLNVHLIKAPLECIDYVILHELCHIAEHNHSERFYRLMNEITPGWEVVKARLDSLASRLLSNSL